MYCSRCGKKVLDSMLFCPFCGAEIIIPEQDVREEPEPKREAAKAETAFSFDLPDAPEKADPPKDEAPEESAAAETIFPWELPDAPEPAAEQTGVSVSPQPEKTERETPLPEAFMPEADDAPPVESAPEESAPPTVETPKQPDMDRRRANAGNIVPGHRKNATLVPDKASMFMDDADDFDEDFDDDFDDDIDETDEYDDYEEELRRASRRRSPARQARKPRYYDEDAEEDEDDGAPGFLSRHIRGIVGILLFLILIAIMAFYLLSDAGQLSLAKINATLPLRAEIYSRVAYDCYQSGDYAKSGVYYERALARDSDSYNYASSAAMAYIAGGDNDKAAEMLKKCIQLKPEAVEPYVYLLNLYPNENSRPWDVAQMLRQGYEKTGDARLQAAANPSGSAGVSNATAQE